MTVQCIMFSLRPGMRPEATEFTHHYDNAAAALCVLLHMFHCFVCAPLHTAGCVHTCVLNAYIDSTTCAYADVAFMIKKQTLGNMYSRSSAGPDVKL